MLPDAGAATVAKVTAEADGLVGAPAPAMIARDIAALEATADRLSGRGSHKAGQAYREAIALLRDAESEVSRG